MINYYEIEVKGKNVYRFFNKIIDNKINVFDVKYKTDSIIFKISYEDYFKIKAFKTIYEIKIIKVQGIQKVKKLVNFYKMYLTFFVIGLFLVFMYSKLILRININADSEKVKKVILKELNDNNITLFSFSKSYKNLKKVTTNIKEKNKDLIDFIEIDKDGVIYNVNIIEKVKKDNTKKMKNNNIVASKNGVILDMYVTIGEIIKNKGDYVSKGDVIISGNITKDEEIKNTVSAKGKVYAETWYKIKITHPKTFKEQQNSKGETKFILNILNKEITLFKINNKKLDKEKDIMLFKNNLFSFIISKNYVTNLVEKTYENDYLINVMEQKAKEEMLTKLNNDEKILLQKTLKIKDYDDKIYMEVFFKVYENIAQEEEIKEKIEIKEKE